MYSFMNDYSEGAHPRILEKMMDSNLEQNVGYGEDAHSDRAKQCIKAAIGREDVDIHLIPGGTQTNLLVISSFLRPHQCVIAAKTGHINVHETGAIEATGHKVLAMESPDGKLTPDLIMEAVKSHTDEHMVQPKMVYISNSTELGTIYQKAELEAIHRVCKEQGLMLFLDGARLGSALTCRENDLSLPELASIVDVFYIGGTKNGALLGEALILCNEAMKEDFRFLIKQRGALMAKGFVIGIQFEVLFCDGLFYELGSHANKMAQKMVRAIEDTGYSFYVTPHTNQIFAIFPNDMLKEMEQKFLFSYQETVDASHSAIRLVTSWATTRESVQAFEHFLTLHKK